MPLAVVNGSGGTPTLYWVHVDHLMRPIRMSDANAATVWSAVYAPFGATTSVTANPEVMNARFPGQWFQLETGLAYNWHRHYDATIGRYIQPDPLAIDDGDAAIKGIATDVSGSLASQGQRRPRHRQVDGLADRPRHHHELAIVPRHDAGRTKRVRIRGTEHARQKGSVRPSGFRGMRTRRACRSAL